MFAAVTPYLRCPVCGGGLAAADGDQPPRALRCPRGHSFDVARQGYVHLGAGRSPHAGDTAAMVAARADFLAAGHYDFISAALAGAAAELAAAAGPPATAGTPATAG
ncbi:MAG TPA: 23S rRNA methyltransferase, partial [Pilimelia sp.]|nr:23S rRNA methyltransferase [Pilimelia sp.]